jgi:hypothetical protein
VKHIFATYVTLVGAGMHRDAVGPKSFTVNGYMAHIGHIFTASIAQSSHFVDVNT